MRWKWWPSPSIAEEDEEEEEDEEAEGEEGEDCEAHGTAHITIDAADIPQAFSCFSHWCGDVLYPYDSADVRLYCVLGAPRLSMGKRNADGTSTPLLQVHQASVSGV